MSNGEHSTMSPNDGIPSQAEIQFRCYVGKFLFTPEDRRTWHHNDSSKDQMMWREAEKDFAQYAIFYAILEAMTTTVRLQCLEQAFATRYRKMKNGVRAEPRPVQVWNVCSFDRLMKARCAETEAKVRDVLGSPVHNPGPASPSVVYQ